MSDDQSASCSLVRTFADGVGEYRCVAAALPASPTSGWVAQVDASFVGIDGVERPMASAAPERERFPFDARPTKRDLHEVIDRFVGDERRRELIETSALTRQIAKMLELVVEAVGGLIHDPGLGVVDPVSHASHVARVLAMGQGPEVSEQTGFLVRLARGMHPEPPKDWMDSPTGAIAAWEGVVEQEPLGEAMSASAAAATLGEEEGRDAIVRLVDSGLLDRHPVTGVTRASVRALRLAREEAGQDSSGEAA